jgi:hypothetical protein
MPATIATDRIDPASHSARLLEAWDRACAATEVARGAVLAQQLGLQPVAVAATVARTAASMIELHRTFFGDIAEMIMTCASCGESLEVEVDLAACGAGQSTADRREIVTGAGPMVVRALTITDLIVVRDCIDPVDALLERLVPDGADDRAALSADDRELIDAVAQDLAGAAGTVISARCPGCGALGRSGLDPTALVWERVERWALDQLAVVAALARAYGWSETEVLALSPTRRARYLELAQT